MTQDVEALLPAAPDRPRGRPTPECRRSWALGLILPAAALTLTWACFLWWAPAPAAEGHLAWAVGKSAIQGPQRVGPISWVGDPLKCVTVDTDRPDPGSPLSVAECKDDPQGAGRGQEFRLGDSGLIQWEVLNNLCLSTADSNQVQLAECGNKPQLQFMVMEGREGRYSIQPALELERCLAVVGDAVLLGDCDDSDRTNFYLPSAAGDVSPLPGAPRAAGRKHDEATSSPWWAPIAGFFGKLAESSQPQSHHHPHEAASQPEGLVEGRSQRPPPLEPATHRVAPPDTTLDTTPRVAPPGYYHPVARRPAPAAAPGPREGLTTFYVYRAQKDEDYEPENVNVGDLTGVMYYLHNEVVRSCPRKFDVSRIKRFRLTVLAEQIGDFVAFDSARCTVPHCNAHWEKSGYVVGCQNIPVWEDHAAALWYSLPGPCPSANLFMKTEQCMVDEPGGRCSEVTGDKTCTYSVEDAGEVRLDDLTGISGDYNKICYSTGFREYQGEHDRGRGIAFWDGYKDPANCEWREDQVRKAFRDNYPDMPEELDPPPRCSR